MSPFLGVLGAAVGLIGLRRMSFWTALSAVALLALAGVDFFRSRQFPLLSVYASSIVVRRNRLLGRAQQISFTQLAGWRHSSRFLCLESTESKKTFVDLRRFSDAERRRLTGLLESLKLGQPGFSGPTAADMTRHEWKLMGTLAGIGIGIVLFFEVLHLLGLG